MRGPWCNTEAAKLRKQKLKITTRTLSSKRKGDFFFFPCKQNASIKMQMGLEVCEENISFQQRRTQTTLSTMPNYKHIHYQ